MLKGKHVSLSIAKLEERPQTYEMGLSTAYMKNRFALDFPNGYTSFAQNYDENHFDNKAPSVCGAMMISVAGEPVGFISYCAISFGKIYLKPQVMEMDIWMNGEENCGKGFGHDAICTLMKHLNATYGIHTFIMCPEKTNVRAVRSYEKAGFAAYTGKEKQHMVSALYTPEFLEQEEMETLSDEYAFMVNKYK